MCIAFIILLHLLYSDIYNENCAMSSNKSFVNSTSSESAVVSSMTTTPRKHQYTTTMQQNHQVSSSRLNFIYRLTTVHTFMYLLMNFVLSVYLLL